MSYQLDNSDDPALACAGKEYFDSLKKAKSAARNIIRRKLGDGRTTMSAYRCPHCDGYHIGSVQPARLRRSALRRLVPKGCEMKLDELKTLLATWRDPAGIHREPDYVCDIALAHIEKMEDALRKASIAMISWRKDDALTGITAISEALRHVSDQPAKSQTGSAAAPRLWAILSGSDCKPV